MPDHFNGAVVRQLYSREHLARLGFSHSNNWFLKAESEGRFPKRIYLSSQSVAWIRSEVDAHIEALAAAREVA